MAQFEYSGRDASGERISGTLSAQSADEVASQLFGDRVTPIEIRQVKTERKPQQKNNRRKAADDAKANSKLKEFLTGKKIEIDDLSMFARQMYSLTKAGLPLDRSIRGLRASLSNKRMQDVLEDVLYGLENGVTLASALGRHPKVFSQLFLSLVHVGENTGRLDLAFYEINKYLEMEKHTRKKVKSATRYPIFVLVAIAIALAVIMVLVIPVFKEAFDSFGAALPWQTQVLITTSDFVVAYWPYLAGAFAAAYLVFFRWTGTDKGALSWDKTKLGFPIYGDVVERIALGRFARTFSMVMRAGVPIVQGLFVVANAVGNRHIAKHVGSMKDGVERGESLYTTAVKTNMFSPLVLQMIAVGEESGQIDELMEEVADFYEAEVEYDIERLGDSIEPILIVFIAGLVLVLALGVFLPIWDLNTAVN